MSSPGVGLDGLCRIIVARGGVGILTQGVTQCSNNPAREGSWGTTSKKRAPESGGLNPQLPPRTRAWRPPSALVSTKRELRGHLLY